MKFSITLKSSDGFNDGIQDAAEKKLFGGATEEEQEAYYNLTPSLRREALDELTEDLREFVRRWVRGGEYVTLIFDTEARTCEVKPVLR